MAEKLTVKALLDKHHLSLDIICILAGTIEEAYALYRKKPVARTIAERFLVEVNRSAKANYTLDALDIPLVEPQQADET